MYTYIKIITSSRFVFVFAGTGDEFARYAPSRYYESKWQVQVFAIRRRRQKTTDNYQRRQPLLLLGLGCSVGYRLGIACHTSVTRHPIDRF
jgi:hypothetical protein